MNHNRHVGIFQVPPHFSVHIVGAGGLGAMTALVLAKMGVRLMTVCDDDIVSEQNIPTQLPIPTRSWATSKSTVSGTSCPTSRMRSFSKGRNAA